MSRSTVALRSATRTRLCTFPLFQGCTDWLRCHCGKVKVSEHDIALQYGEGHQGCHHQGAVLEVLRGHGRLPRTNKVYFQLK